MNKFQNCSVETYEVQVIFKPTAKIGSLGSSNVIRVRRVNFILPKLSLWIKYSHVLKYVNIVGFFILMGGAHASWTNWSRYKVVVN